MSSILSPVASPTGVVRDQWDTLRVGRSKKRRDYGAIAVIYVIPMLFGICAGIWGNPVVDTAALLAAVAVYTGLIFNLSFNVFDKSLAIRNDPFREGDEVTLELVDELFANVNYTVVVGLITTAVLVSASLFPAPDHIAWVARVTVAIVAGLSAHLFLMSGMIIKRFRSLREALKP